MGVSAVYAPPATDGQAIVAEARERGSDLISISTEHAPRGEKLLGPTTIASAAALSAAERLPTPGR